MDSSSCQCLISAWIPCNGDECRRPLHRRRLHRGNRSICPGTYEGTGAKITFCPGNLQRVYDGLNLVTTGSWLHRLNCAQTTLFGLSVTPSMCRSVRLESFAEACTATFGRWIHILTDCWKETLNPADPVTQSLVGLFDAGLRLRL